MERTDPPLGRRMRILMCITPSHFSGAERVLVNLAAGLQARGHAVRVLTKAEPALCAALTEHRVPVEVAAIAGKANLRAPGVIADAASAMGADLIYTVLSSASLWG